MKQRKSIRTSISGNKKASETEERPASRRITQQVGGGPEEPPEEDEARVPPSESREQSAGAADVTARERAEAEPVDSPDPFKSAELLLEIVGENAVRPLAGNPRLQIPTPEAATRERTDESAPLEPREWLADLIRAFLTRDGMAHLQGSLQAALAEPQRFQSQLAQLRAQWDDMEASYQSRLQEAERELSDIRVEQKRTREQLQRSASVRELTESAFGEGGSEGAVREILREALEEPSEALGSFVGAVCLGWVEVRSVLQQTRGEEEHRMEIAEKALRRFLGYVAGQFIPERREVLKRVGQAVNAYFEEYDFVSPEDWRHIDTAVHNATGVGGQSVKEGLSYVVLRRNSGQTVVYADITTE